jgi:hypothetical protein
MAITNSRNMLKSPICGYMKYVVQVVGNKLIYVFNEFPTTDTPS